MSDLPGSGDELLVFGAESVATDETATTRVWHILIVDDEPDVHQATEFALVDTVIQGRPLVFLHAYSGAEALQVLKTIPDIAAILLDVVMEQEDSGLRLIKVIREDLKMTDVRIILRTGQPGYAPEVEAIRDYDINDYKTKSELTRSKLYATVTAAIRSYEQLKTIQAGRDGLEIIVRSSAELMALQGLKSFAAGVITQIAALLGVEPEGLVCAQEESDGGLRVVAGAGRYTDSINRPVSELPDPRVAQALLHCIESQQNLYDTRSTTLFLGGETLTRVAVFLDLPLELDLLDRSLLQVFCANIAVGFDNVTLFSRLKGVAYVDPVTRLPNRNRFVELVASAMAEPQAHGQSCVALLDLDNFGAINDAFGHRFGDLLLAAVGQALRAQLPPEVVVARLSGDVFGLLGAADQLAPQAVMQCLEGPLTIDGRFVVATATMGLCLMRESRGEGADVVKDANLALKQAKMQSRRGHAWFRPEMAQQVRDRIRMLQALELAFKTSELSLWYQPQISLADHRVVGVEALMRWRAPEGQLIPPDHFIPVAESSGLIVEMGRWALREACYALMRLRSGGWTQLRMSVNVSMAQFRDPNFLATLNQALADSQLPPQMLELEVTESVASGEMTLFVELLDQIKQLGVSVAVDDFGTGYSSLSYLQTLDVDTLKIDRAFVREVSDSASACRIAEMVVRLGHELGMRVIAEGVETPAQRDLLAQMGCDEAQGWHYAKAMPEADLQAWLRAG